MATTFKDMIYDNNRQGSVSHVSNRLILPHPYGCTQETVLPTPGKAECNDRKDILIRYPKF